MGRLYINWIIAKLFLLFTLFFVMSPLPTSARQSSSNKADDSKIPELKAKKVTKASLMILLRGGKYYVFIPVGTPLPFEVTQSGFLLRDAGKDEMHIRIYADTEEHDKHLTEIGSLVFDGLSKINQKEHRFDISLGCTENGAISVAARHLKTGITKEINFQNKTIVGEYTPGKVPTSSIAVISSRTQYPDSIKEKPSKKETPKASNQLYFIIMIILVFIGAVVPFYFFVIKKNKNIRPFNEAMTFIENEQFSEALEKLSNITLTNVKSRSFDQDVLFFRAYCHFKIENLDEARFSLQELLNHVPKHKEGLYLFGYIHTSNGTNDRALEVWEKLYSEESTFLETSKYLSLVLFRLASEALKEEKIDQALALFERVKELKHHLENIPPNLRNVQLLNATRALFDNKFSDAQQYYNNLHQQSASLEEPEKMKYQAFGKLGLSLVWIRQEKYQESVELFNEAFNVLCPLGTRPKVTKLGSPLEEQLEELDEEPATETAVKEKKVDQTVGSKDLRSENAVSEETKKEEATEEQANKENAAEPKNKIPSIDKRCSRGLYFLSAILKLDEWGRFPQKEIPAKIGSYKDEIISLLQTSLHYDKVFADAKLIVGFLIYYFEEDIELAINLLEQARNAGVREPVVLETINKYNAVKKRITEAKKIYFEKMQEYIDDPEVKQELKKIIIDELNQYEQFLKYHEGRLVIRDMDEREPTLAILYKRAELLGQKIKEAIQNLKPDEKGKKEKIAVTMSKLGKVNTELEEKHSDVQKLESELLIDTGIYLFSEE